MALSREVLVRLVADATGAKKGIGETTAEMKKFGSYTAEATLKLQTEGVQAKLDKLNLRLKRYGEQTQTADVKIRMGSTARQIERLQRELHGLTSGTHEVKVRVSEHGGGGHGGSGALSGLLGGIASRGGAIAAGAGGAGFAAFEIIKKVSEAYGQEQVSQARLQTQLRALNIDYKTHADRIQEVIDHTSELSGLTGHDLNDAFVNIVRSTGNVGQSLKLMGLAADLARDKHLSAAKAGQLIAKVAAGNVSALSRYGITVKKGATATEALGILQHRLAGQAAAYGKTQQGSLDRVNVAFERLKEHVGKELAPAIAKAASAVARFINQMLHGKGAGGEFVTVLKTIGRVLGAMAHAAKLAIAAVIDRFRGLVQEVRGIVRIISGVLTLNFGRAWSGVKDVFSGGIRTIKSILEGAIAPFVAIGRSLGSGFVNGLIDVVNAGIKVLNTVLGPRNLGPFGHTPDLRIGEIGHVDFSSHASGVKINQRNGTSAPGGGDPRGVFSGGARTRRGRSAGGGVGAAAALAAQRASANVSPPGIAGELGRRFRQAATDAAPSIAAAISHHDATHPTRQGFAAEHIGKRLVTVGEELAKQLKANVHQNAALLPRLTDVAYHPVSGRMQHTPTRHGLGAAGHVHHHDGATVQVTTPGGIQYPDAEAFAASLQRKLAAKGNG